MKKYIFVIVFIPNLFAQVDYSTQIQPIFDNNCTSCHVNGGTYSGGLDLSSYAETIEGGSSGNTIIPSDHANSVLYNRITLPVSDQQFMPKNGSPLYQSDIDLIIQWINEGALETLVTAFQPQTKQELQTAVNLWADDNTTALATYGEINEWDVSLITDMLGLFDGITSFNDGISNWDVSNVTNMSEMFADASSFNQNLSTWNVSNVTDMSGMYNEASSFNQNLSTWNVSSVTNMSAMFLNASIYNMSLSSWNVSNVIYMNHMFENAENFNEDITNWDVSSVTDMAFMFSNASNFNQNISNWDLSSLNTTDHMFDHASSFNQDISAWNMSNVGEMYAMFDGASSLSDENKCAIHTSFSSNSNWAYDWSSTCALSLDYSSIVPDKFLVYQNYPNPFNPVTSLRYDLPEDGLVNITIYDMMGRVVKTLVNISQTAGYKSIKWNATNDRNDPVSAGLYLYTIQAGEFRQTKKMLLLK